MGIFSTREIAIIIWAIILLLYVSLRKKGRAAILPVIKAACQMKLIIPFIFVLLYAAAFVWLCTYLPLWDWLYLKDIIFWTLFVGVPVCFNATSRELEEHYFRDIVIDNLKFTALAEFFTGTFTFNIVVELILQPTLVFLVALQAVAKNKAEKVVKLIDGIMGITGLIIILFTIKNAYAAIGHIVFIDIIVSFIVPILLSILYLPVAYCFAVYSKYELLFLRMRSKEPKDKKTRIVHRIKVLQLCKLSYKKVCKFLYGNQYLGRMYINMSNDEFNSLIDTFRGTTEHTYLAVIKHNDQYYLTRALSIGAQFSFSEHTVQTGGLFKNSNKKLREEIAKQIQSETPFRNTDNTGKHLCRSVSLRRRFFFKKAKIAFFISNHIVEEQSSVSLPYCSAIKQHCTQDSCSLMKKLKCGRILLPIIVNIIYGLGFFVAAQIPFESTFNFDLVAFFYVLSNYALLIFKAIRPLKKSKMYRYFLYVENYLSINGLGTFFVFFIALVLTFAWQPNIDSQTLSLWGISFIFVDAICALIQRDQ